MDLTKSWVESEEQAAHSQRAKPPSKLKVSPRQVHMVDAVVGGVIHQVFTVSNRGDAPARFKVFFRKPDPRTKRANHGFVHYSLAGVVSFPAISSQFTVEFHANVVGTFSNVLVLQTETQEIEIPFRARVGPQSKHVSRFRRCWPAHKIPLNLSEDELEDFQMLPRLPMCYWDFEAEQMVVASMVAPEGGGKRSGSGNGKKSGAHFFYCVDPDLSIAELEEQARKDEDDYATQLEAALPFPRRVALFRNQNLTGDQFIVPVPQRAKIAPLPLSMPPPHLKRNGRR
eukprot:INCI16333.17.p1 GENE.INCI16333.17~~INCI16333.17.p1  ORF type:complete len:285 (+),score=42.55 INCI16333.17:386-1240(+)